MNSNADSDVARQLVSLLEAIILSINPRLVSEKIIISLKRIMLLDFTANCQIDSEADRQCYLQIILPKIRQESLTSGKVSPFYWQVLQFLYLNILFNCCTKCIRSTVRKVKKSFMYKHVSMWSSLNFCPAAPRHRISWIPTKTYSDCPRLEHINDFSSSSAALSRNALLISSYFNLQCAFDRSAVQLCIGGSEWTAATELKVHIS